MARDEGQLGGTGNFAVGACINPYTFTLIQIIATPNDIITVHIDEEIVVIRRDIHFRKHQLGHRTSFHIRQQQLVRAVAIIICKHPEQVVVVSTDMFVHPTVISQVNIDGKCLKVLAPREGGDGVALSGEFHFFAPVALEGCAEEGTHSGGIGSIGG